MKEKLEGMKWGLCSLGNRRAPLKGESIIAMQTSPDSACRNVDAAILERLSRTKIWLETLQAAEEAEEAGNMEEASALYEKAEKMKKELEEEAKKHTL